MYPQGNLVMLNEREHLLSSKVRPASNSSFSVLKAKNKTYVFLQIFLIGNIQKSFYAVTVTAVAIHLMTF